MKNIETISVGELAISNYRYADIFMKYGIDFCCGGKKSLRDACHNIESSLDEIISELNRADDNGAVINEADVSLDQLIDHIEDKHHTYVREALPILISYADKVARAHGDKYPELLEIRGLLNVLENDLMPHLSKEEVILFPYIRQMLGDSTRLALPIDTVFSPIEVMLKEHDRAGDIFKRINELTGKYQLPSDACVSFKAFYRVLDEFEKDLYRHIHLENNILFPKAIDLENSLNTNINHNEN